MKKGNTVYRYTRCKGFGPYIFTELGEGVGGVKV